MTTESRAATSNMYTKLVVVGLAPTTFDDYSKRKKESLKQSIKAPHWSVAAGARGGGSLGRTRYD